MIDFWYPVAILLLTKASYTILRKSDFFQFRELRNHIQTQEFPIFILGILCVAFSRPNWIQLLLLVIAVILTFFYGMHVFFGDKTKTLRSSAILKLIVITSVWTIIVILVPLFHAKPVLSNNQVVFTIMQFLFILGMTIPFDISDYERQSQLGFLTLPKLYGVDVTKKIARNILILTWIAAGFQGFTVLIVMSVIVILFLWFLQNISEEHSIEVYSWRFDGLLILQSILFIAFSIISNL